MIYNISELKTNICLKKGFFDKYSRNSPEMIIFDKSNIYAHYNYL